MHVNKIKRSIRLHVQENYSLYAFVTVLFLMGIIFGAVIVNSLTDAQRHDLFTYVSRFFGQVSDGNFARAADMFHQSYSYYLKYVAIMWLLGLSVIGLPIILILLFVKGIVVGFTVGFLVNQMGWHGFLLSFVSVLPQNLVLVPCFIIVTAASISFSIKMIRKQFMKRTNEPFFPSFLKYSCLIIGMGIFLIIVSAFEAYVSPGLMKSVISLTR
ncbi:stage II sporulation protein M [Fictibacillus sp. Mic-4]|uniref:stage II sporulation protein M n=1 Tax=Fictibacillus TaxID=1329200 RepID=UPI0004205762|nr:stage II sporulation protein M [Fictibacillus gelatini]